MVAGDNFNLILRDPLPNNSSIIIQHHQGNQFVCLYDCGIRSYDIRDPNHCVWQIEDGQFIRDLDCNPNKQCLLVTGGDDGTLKIWDTRNIKEPVFLRSDHSHW